VLRGDSRMTIFMKSAPRVIAWMCAAHVASMAGISTYATLLPRLQDEWGLNNSQAGLISGAFFGGYMAAVPLLSSLTDRVDARRVYLVSSLVAGAALLAFALLAQGVTSAALLQLLAGAGIAGTYMPGLRALTDNLQGTLRQSRAVAFYTAVFGLGTSLSIFMAGQLADAQGWRWAFAFAALGPLLAGCMVVAGLPPRKPVPRHATHVLDFRPVLRNRELRPYIFGYAVHCWELFGSRSWLVAFIMFAQEFEGAGGASPAAWSAVTIAAVANLFGPPASIAGNELAMRHGRERWIWMAMLASGLLTCTLGFLAALPWYLMATLAMLHMSLVMGDSSALTAGLVTRADERIRGAAMAVHSMLGFGAGLVAPLAFGAVLDLSGGKASPFAWGLAFTSLGAGAVLMSTFIRARAAAAAPAA
jgi:MFS family permease